MRKTVMFAVCVAFIPATAFAIGSGMGMYGTASFGGGGGGNSSAESAQAEYAAAMRLMDKQDYPAALRHLIHTNTISPGNAEVLNDIGYTTRMTGDYDTSVEYLQRAVSRDPELKTAYTNLGLTYLSMHQPDQARQQLDALKHLCPNGCSEQDTLSESLSTYDAAAKAPVAPSGASSK